IQARWLGLTVRDSRTPTTRTQKLSRRLLRNETRSRRLSRRAAMTLRVIRTPMSSSDESGILPASPELAEKRVVPWQCRHAAANLVNSFFRTEFRLAERGRT